MTDMSTQSIATSKQPRVESATPSEAAVALAQASRGLFCGRTVVDTLQCIVDLSLETVRGCDGASVSFVQDGAVVTPAWTEDSVIEADLMQYASGEGPCLDAIAHEATFYSTDLASDPRWPVFGPQAARLGMHSLLSFRLGTAHTLGSLNLYARGPAAYDEDERLEALAFSIHAGIALASADALEATTHVSKRVSRLERALTSRNTIALAQGVLMGGQGIDAHEAFTLLRNASLHMNLKLLDVALNIVETGVLPWPDQTHR